MSIYWPLLSAGVENKTIYNFMDVPLGFLFGCQLFGPAVRRRVF